MGGLQEARTREQALRQEWQEIAAAMEQAPAGASAYPVAVFNEQAFLEVGWGRRACRTWRWPAAVMHANVALALH